jgi:Cu-processing system ATP-binding protein
VIRFHEVTKRFGRHTAVDRVSFDIGQEKVTALLGPNGSGKTTSLKMAAGLVRPDAGCVAVGLPPLPAWTAGARARLSYLPQRVAFPDTLTGAEVVEFYRRLRGAPADRAPAALRFAGLNGAGSRAVSTYSGGMTQRLGLAVALLPDADVLLLDEPTAALDPEGLGAFYALIEARRRDGRTVLFTSHQVGDVERLADRVLVLHKGALVAEFTRETLRDWLDARGVLRVRVRNAASALDAVRPLAPSARLDGDEIVVAGRAADRAAVVDAIRAAGCEIQGLVAENGRLDALYAELLDQASKAGARP